MKRLIRHISLLVFSLSSNAAGAAMVDYVCNMDESIVTSASQGMYSKKYREDRKLILSLVADGSGASIELLGEGEPIFWEDYTVTRADGVIRWEKLYRNAFWYFTLWTDTMRVIEINQVARGATSLDTSKMESGTCELKL